MSPSDFQSLIRRRNVDDLIDRLKERGIWHRQIAGTGLANVEEASERAQNPTTAETTTMAANSAVGSPVAAVAHIDKQSRPASSVYYSYRSESSVQDLSSRPASFEYLPPPPMFWQNSPESSSSIAVGSIDPDHMFPAAVEVSDHDHSIANPIVSCSSWASAASLWPAPLNVPRSGNSGGDSRRSPASADKIPMTVDPRTPDRKSNSTSSVTSANAADYSPALTSQGTSKGSSSRTSLSSPAKSIPSSATSASNVGAPSEDYSQEGQPWRRRLLSSARKSLRATRTKLLSVTGFSTTQVDQQTEEDLKAELLDLQQRYKRRQIGLPDLCPGFDHMVELDRLQRKLSSLDFDAKAMAVVASDMTTCLQVPLVQFWGDSAHVNVDLFDQAYQKHCQKYFRARLSRRVDHRVTWLKFRSRYGSAREIEDWYREVVGLIGWCDEAEACLPWSWRANDNWL
jgi:hypothetical protein